MMLNVGGDIWCDSRLGNSVLLPILSVPPLFGALEAGGAWPVGAGVVVVGAEDDVGAQATSKASPAPRPSW